MHRFFLPAMAVRQGAVSFPAPFAHQLRQVLRLRPGDRVQVADNSGWVLDVELTEVSGRAVEGVVKAKTLGQSEPRTKITIYQGLLKGDRFEHVLQKCTELGATAFVPLICDRSVVANVRSLEGPKLEARQARWQEIIREAAEQSRRDKLPQLRPPTLFRQACESARGMCLLLSENERQRSLRQALREAAAPAGLRVDALPEYEAVERIPLRKLPQREAVFQRPFSMSLFVGPEGGFSPEELELGERLGLIPVGLGPRVLRAETAAIVATGAVLYEWEDLG